MSKENNSRISTARKIGRVANCATALTVAFAILLLSGILPDIFRRSFFIVPFTVIFPIPAAACFLFQFVGDISKTLRPSPSPTQARPEEKG